MKEGNIGINQDLYLTSPLDVWTYEARGSSARVFLGALRNSRDLHKPVAVKIMRPKEKEYALPLFKEEIKILKAIDDLPGVVRMVELGFIKPDDSFEFPDDKTSGGCNSLAGTILRYELNEDLAEDQIDHLVSLGWLPYIALGVKHHQHNLLMLCDRARTPKHRPFPLQFAFEASTQICGILSQAHKRNIVYLDHKILHYYWNNNLTKAYIIDWNVGKLHANLTDANKNFDIVQFGARALHFIFTGRAAPGAPALGPTRPEEIQRAPHSYRVEWRRYDDKHIPSCIKEILSAVLEGAYRDFPQLQSDIEACRGNN